MDQKRFQEEMSKIYADLKAQDDRVKFLVHRKEILIAVAFGYQACKHGMNLKQTIASAEVEIEKEKL